MVGARNHAHPAAHHQLEDVAAASMVFWSKSLIWEMNWLV
jgi:hypothetical protein